MSVDEMLTKEVQLDANKVQSNLKNLRDPFIRFAQRYQAFFDSTNDAIAVFSPAGEILDANPQLIQLSGYSYDILVTKSIHDLFDNPYDEEILVRFQILMEGQKRKYPIECELQCHSGKGRPIEIGLSLLKNQYGYPRTFLATIRDVTRQKSIEKRLVQRAEEIQKIFDTVPTILFVIDQRKRIRRINRSGLEALLKEEENVLGESIGEVLGCVDRLHTARGCGFGRQCRKCAIRESILRCLKVGETVLHVEQFITRENMKESPFCYKVNVVPIESRGKRWGVVSLEDITDRKKAEIESLQLHDSLARANLELKKTLENFAKSQSQLLEAQKLEQIGLLASGFAHNLKSPLSGIKGYAQLLKLDQPDCRELGVIVQEVEVMESIINNLMLKSRKGHENKEEAINIDDLLKIELDFLMANMFYKYHVQREIILDKHLPSIQGVYVHFSQSIMNIVQNALDAMYTVEKKMLTVQTRHDDQFIYIDIGDTGCGISDENKNKIFDVFFTSKPTSEEKKGDEPVGTGLGLSSANYLIHQYGGKIDVQSKVGKGTTVTIQIPYIKKKESHSIHKVLIVDDSSTMVDILTQVCQDMGIEAYGTTNGKKAFELYRRLNPCVIVSDLCMPGMTGSELMLKIRKIHSTQRVIYISGYSENPEFREWLTVEMQHPSLCALMRKPFPIDDFKKVLHKMVFTNIGAEIDCV
ncbi:PAS domain S-box protein [bacterium]|nr:PAS domain S-box protein [bacterium]